MKIINITEKEQYNKFVGSQRYSRFAESWGWGEFQRANGRDVRRLAVADDGGKILAAATLIRTGLPLGRAYFYCPCGPAMDQLRIKNYELRMECLNFLLDEIGRMAKDEKVIFLRFEPSYRLPATGCQLTKTIDVQPSKTLILDLAPQEEELLKNMRQKTRYNTRLAERKGVAVREGSVDDFESFWRLMRETKERDGFRTHTREHYRKMIGIHTSTPARRDDLAIKLYLAEYENKVIAGNIIAFFGDTATYMHGASASRYRNVMAPYLLQWHVIRLAKESGYGFYDFYGIDDNKWPGVTRFKRGFGGGERQYPGTYDLIFDGFYYQLYKIARALRRRA